MAIAITEVLGFVANVMSNIAFIPQIIKSYRCKHVQGLSIGMFTVLFLTQLCWIGYAIPLDAWQLWTSSLIEIVLLLPIFVMWVVYRKRSLPVNVPLVSEAMNVLESKRVA